MNETFKILITVFLVVSFIIFLSFIFYIADKENKECSKETFCIKSFGLSTWRYEYKFKGDDYDFYCTSLTSQNNQEGVSKNQSIFIMDKTYKDWYDECKTGKWML